MTYREELSKTHRENFSVGKAIGKAGKATGNAAASAGKATGNAAASAGKAVTSKALSPIGNFFKKIWGWLKFVISICCCCCILGVCMMFGIPQMAFSALSSVAAGSTASAAPATPSLPATPVVVPASIPTS